MEMVPNGGQMCFPMNAVDGCGSRDDFVLIRNPAEESVCTASRSRGCRACGDGARKEISSRYWAKCDLAVRGFAVESDGRWY